jgi:2-haloacid dehalogenase
MQTTRRSFLRQAVAAAATPLLHHPVARAARTVDSIEAIAFDAFTTFDPRPVYALAERLFPGRGAELSNIWRVRQFEYQWLRALAGQYADFREATEAALVYAANVAKVLLTDEKRHALMQAYVDIKAWPDAPPALRALKQSGIRLALLSNASPDFLQAWISNSALTEVYEHVLSTDAIRSYKPDPHAYAMALDAFALPKARIMFAAFGGWDVAGSKWFGYPTYWVNRLQLPVEELSVVPDGRGTTLTALNEFVEARRRA